MINRQDIIICEKIEKSYADGDETREILKDISLSIKSDTINVIYGKSGSGKTTLLSMMEGIEAPTSGKIQVLGKDFYHLSDKEQAKIRGKELGIVFQDYHLIDELTVADNIKLPTIIHHTDLDFKLYAQLIKRMGLHERIDAYPNELSGGEKQRVAIARAMILRPKILFADEPTGNLDEKTSEEIAKLLIEMHDKYNITLVIATHDRQLVKNPDMVIMIENGTVETKEIEKDREK